ncbi:hypothetical protein EV182_001464 [Spiromyces aspiralis]|uniref:Uncharacterized protein n=1 Tax=Spiromyces aspiralis TaxID=68401 RepID=A0ACC1I0Q9_9FUNG|nr:hypothetical protein EV182_001464 [Spiromyces aspiralis]
METKKTTQNSASHTPRDEKLGDPKVDIGSDLVADQDLKQPIVSADAAGSKAKDIRAEASQSPHSASHILETGSAEGSHDSTIQFEMEDSNARLKAISEGLGNYTGKTTDVKAHLQPKRRISVYRDAMGQPLRLARAKSQSIARKCSQSYSKITKPLFSRQDKTRKIASAGIDGSKEGKQDSSQVSLKSLREDGEDINYGQRLTVGSNPKSDSELLDKNQRSAKDADIKETEQGAGRYLTRGRGVASKTIHSARSMFRKAVSTVHR